MNLETWVAAVLVYIAVMVVLVYFRCKARYFILWILAGVLASGICLYRYGAFGNLSEFGSVIEGPVYRGPRTAPTVKQPVPPKIETEKPDIWKEAKQEFQNSIREE